MNKIEKIEYIRQLEIKKVELEKELSNVNKSIEEQKSSCLHVGVDLGYYGLYPSTGNKCRCLICGMGKGKEYFYEPKYIVDASNYLPHYNIKDEEQCNNKFDFIQILATGLLKENPDMSRQELVYRLKNFIQKSISISENLNDLKLIKIPEHKKNKK